MSKLVKKASANKLGSLVKAFRKYYIPFVISIVLLIASVVLTILTPGTIRELTNAINPMDKVVDGVVVLNLANILKLAIKLVVFIGVSFITGFASGFILNTIISIR